MIGFGLRLTVAGGREAAARLVAIAAAVALGVGLLLTTLAAAHALGAQNDRILWLRSAHKDTVTAKTGQAGPDAVWWRYGADRYAGTEIDRIDLAATGPGAPVPPGIPRLPGPREYYASPALAALLDSVPTDQLGDRYPGHRIGTISPSALPAPNSLLILAGQEPDELSHRPEAVPVTRILNAGNCGDHCNVLLTPGAVDLILSVIVGALLFPVLMFIGTATRLAATRREQRFAALRLVGATPRQISVISAVEAAVSALVGTALGFGLFYLLRDTVAAIPFTGAPFFPADLTPTPVEIPLVALGVPAASALAAQWALHRVQISPLGVTRRVTPRPPRAYRLVPLVLGAVELAYFVGRQPRTAAGQAEAYLTGFLLIMMGLVVAGPWLTMLAARLLARRTSRPATLIAARRLADNPKAAFRAISGLVLALFVTTVAVGTIGTLVAASGAPKERARADNLIDDFLPPLASTADPVPAGLTSVPGVRGVTVVYEAPEDLPLPAERDVRFGPPYALARCADLARAASFGHCAPGAQVAWVYGDLLRPGTSAHAHEPWPTAPVDAAGLSRLRAVSLVAATDGTPATIERARTVIETVAPQRYAPYTDAERILSSNSLLDGWRRLADVVVVCSLVLAGCSLAVSVAGGVSDRKRPFALLRLTGVPLGTLRRVIALESAAPLLAAAAMATGAGLLAAHLFLRAQMKYSLRPPGVGYYGVVVLGLAACLGVIAATLPLLRRITGPETARNE
jgi:uncharacterized membrane protein YhaH (DUF805 family)